VGAEGEAVAAEFLRGLGFRVIARNVRVPMGEADLVCEDPDGRTVVIVEVKSRRVAGGAGANGAGKSEAIRPESAVHPRKAAKLVAIAEHLRRVNGWMDRPVRIDVVAVRWVGAGAAEIRHFRRAVRGG
jgi:putative endonuclease